MNQTPEQFRVRCLEAAKECREDFPEFSKGLVRFAETLAPNQRPANDPQVLREFEQRRTLKEIKS